MSGKVAGQFFLRSDKALYAIGDVKMIGGRVPVELMAINAFGE